MRKRRMTPKTTSTWIDLIGNNMNIDYYSRKRMMPNLLNLYQRMRKM